MGKVVFVELLDRKNNIRERVRIDSFPATIGRGYGNTVIIDDRLIDREHLRLSLDGEGGILVEDLNTVNGTRLFKSHTPIQQHRIPAGGEAILRVGQTVLRLRGDEFVVGLASVLPRAWCGAFSRHLENQLIAFVIFAICVGINVLVDAQEITKNDIWSGLLSSALVMLVVFAVWAGFWALLGRVIIHSFRFMTHLAIAGIASVVTLIIDAGAEYFEFFFTAASSSEAIRFAGYVLIVALLLYAHLSVITELSMWKRLLPSVLISAGVFGIAFLVGYTREKEFSTVLPYSSVLKPIGRPLVRTVSPDEFFGDLDQLRIRIDAMAAEKPKKTAGK